MSNLHKAKITYLVASVFWVPDQAAHLGLFLLGVAKIVLAAQVHGVALGKKQAVGYARLLLRVARKAIGVLNLAGIVLHVQTCKQTAVEERDVFEQAQGLAGFAEKARVTALV